MKKPPPALDFRDRCRRTSTTKWYVGWKDAYLTSRRTYPRYSTALFLSRTATEEPGSARQSVALEPSSKSILNSALASCTDFTFPPGGIVAGPAVLIFMRDSIIEQNQNAACLESCDLDCSPGDHFRKFLISRHYLRPPDSIYLPVPPAGEYPRSSASSFRHELALFRFTAVS